MRNSDVVLDLQDTFDRGHTRSYKWRITQLNALQAMLQRHRKEFERALRADLGKTGVDSFVTEISQVLKEISFARKHLKSWLGDERVKTPFSLLPGTSRVRHEPLGVVLIISAWNYPVQLLFSPLVGAIAAGNCAVLKPSEVAAHTAELIARLVPKYLDIEAIDVVCGGPDTVSELIAAKPDKVFFTGSGRVGKVIAKKCAKKLIPVVLELGGKSPVYVHRDADLKTAARRLVWAKFMNAGQTCVAPDHVFVHHKAADRFGKYLVREIKRAYGKNPAKSKAYGRIINTANTERLAGMLTAAGESVILTGGAASVSDCYVAPTVIANVDREHPAMAEEIFGPILPLIPVAGPEEAVQQMLERDKPLALYVFCKRRRLADLIFNSVSSGSAVHNAGLVQLASPYLPFGGVGGSGYGSYHGYYSFKACSHEKSVLYKPSSPDTLRVLYHPVSKNRERLLRGTLLRTPRLSRCQRAAAKRANRRARKLLGDYVK